MENSRGTSNCRQVRSGTRTSGKLNSGSRWGLTVPRCLQELGRTEEPRPNNVTQAEHFKLANDPVSPSENIYCARFSKQDALTEYPHTTDCGEQPTPLDVIYNYYVNKDNIETCPQINFLNGKQRCQGIIDTGCQTSIISEDMFNELISKGVPSLQLPAQHVMLVSAFGGKSKRIRRQVMLELEFENNRIDHVFLISGQLVTPILFGLNFCIEQGLVIDFSRRKFTLDVDGEALELDFAYARGEDNVSKIDSPEYRQVSEVRHLTTSQPTLTQTTADNLPDLADTKFCEGDPCFPLCSPNKKKSEDKFLCFVDSSGEDKEEANYRIVEYGPVQNVLYNHEGLVLRNSENTAGNNVDDDDDIEAMNVEAKRRAACSGQNGISHITETKSKIGRFYGRGHSIGNHARTTAKKREFEGFGKR
jgi:hypothetical protein